MLRTRSKGMGLVSPNQDVDNVAGQSHSHIQCLKYFTCFRSPMLERQGVLPSFQRLLDNVRSNQIAQGSFADVTLSCSLGERHSSIGPRNQLFLVILFVATTR